MGKSRKFKIFQKPKKKTPEEVTSGPRVVGEIISGEGSIPIYGSNSEKIEDINSQILDVDIDQINKELAIFRKLDNVPVTHSKWGIPNELPLFSDEDE